MPRYSRCSAWLFLGILGMFSGCAGLKVDRCADIPPGAIPEPPQTTVGRIMETQAAKAEADDFVVYKHEFWMDGKDLGPYGQYHMRLIAGRLGSAPFPVLIQAVPDPKLNEQRRQTVIAALKRAGHEDIDPRVILGFPEAEGLGGNEAEIIFYSSPDAGTGVTGNGVFNRGGGLFNNSGFNNGGFFGRPNSGFFRSGFGNNSFPF